MKDYILQHFEELEADGITFHSFSRSDLVVCSFTKEEWLINTKGCPKCPYYFWKEIDGRKIKIIWY